MGVPLAVRGIVMAMPDVWIPSEKADHTRPVGYTLVALSVY